MSAFIAWRGHALLALLARFYLGAVFVYASLHKIANPGSFALDVATYDLLPLGLVNLMALVLPYVELVAGVLVIIGWRTRAAALLITVMMTVFVVAVSFALARGLDTSCGCFASQSMAHDPISVLTVLRDVAWLQLAAYVTLFDRRPLGLDRLVLREARHRDQGRGPS